VRHYPGLRCRVGAPQTIDANHEVRWWHRVNDDLARSKGTKLQSPSEREQGSGRFGLADPNLFQQLPVASSHQANFKSDSVLCCCKTLQLCQSQVQQPQTTSRLPRKPNEARICPCTFKLSSLFQCTTAWSHHLWREWSLTLRSSGAPTAVKRARATVQVCIFCSAGPLAYRCRPLSSNVRPHNNADSRHPP
jgi:hypothetical protein